jgi:hypothetical protein
MDSEIAEILGIDKSRCKSGIVSAFGGEKKAFIEKVRISVPDFPTIITSGVLFAEDPDFDIILGQQDFFHRFKIRFEKAKNKFYLDIA